MTAFNKFDDVTHMPLRVFNRVAMFYNLHEDKGAATAKEYASLFTQKERAQMYILMNEIKIKGVDKVRKWATKDLVVTYDPTEDLDYA